MGHTEAERSRWRSHARRGTCLACPFASSLPPREATELLHAVRAPEIPCRSHALDQAVLLSYTARRIIDRLRETGSSSTLELLKYFKLPHKTDREHQLWQEGSHPQMIADERMMWQKLEYIHNNPVRRGYVDDPIHWRYSSAKNYSKLPALVPVIVDWM